MKNIFPPFAKLVAVMACALTLGSCNRAEYAMLPKGGSYHGVTRVATPVPAAATAATPTPAPVAETAADAAPQAAPASTVATAAPVSQSVSKPAQPVAPAPAASTLGTASTVAAPAPKLSALQRIALNKVTRKVDKLMQSTTTARQHDNTASTSKTSAISGNLRTGLILLLVGLLVGLFNGLIGTIIALIGVIFIVLWLLDSL